MSKKYFSKIIAALVLAVTLIMTLAVVPALAAGDTLTYKKGANDVSDSYKNSKYYTQLTSLILSGDNATDVLAVALSQLGYRSGSSAQDLGGVTSKNEQCLKYNEMAYNIGAANGSDWGAAFVAFCLYQAGATDKYGTENFAENHKGDKNYIWTGTNSTDWAENLKAAGAFKASPAAGGAYKPVSGDLIFLNIDTSSKEAPDVGETPSETPDTPIVYYKNMGIVVYTDNTYVFVIEADNNANMSSAADRAGEGNGVYLRKYELGSTDILGYGVLPYASVKPGEKIDYSGNNPTPGTYLNAYENARHLYPDDTLTPDYVNTVPSYAHFKVLEVIKKETTNDDQFGEDISVLKVEYNGKIGYVQDTEAMRFLQFTHTHSFTKEISEDAYKATDATCRAKATYFKSCETCGAAGTETFTIGGTNPQNHKEDAQYTTNNDGTHAKSYPCCNTVVNSKEPCQGKDSSCTTSICDLCKTAYGSSKSHFFTKVEKNATYHWTKCENCNEVTEKAPHIFDKEDKCECGAKKNADLPPTSEDFIFNPNGKLPENCEMIVNSIDVNSEDGQKILESISKYNYNKEKGVVIFDIHASNAGEKIQPTGAIEIKVSKPIIDVENYVIYHIKEADGTIEVINSVAEDGNISFEVTSFSSFVFAEKVESNGNGGLPTIAIIAIAVAAIVLVQVAVFGIIKIAKKK